MEAGVITLIVDASTQQVQLMFLDGTGKRYLHDRSPSPRRAARAGPQGQPGKDGGSDAPHPLGGLAATAALSRELGDP